MKLFAYRNRDDAVLTNVWEYAKAIKDPNRQEEFKKNNVFYSLNRDVEKRKRMYAKRTPKGFYAFAFFPNEDDEYTRAVEKKYGQSGESFTHAFIKETFLSLDEITLKYEGRTVKLFGLNAVDEYKVMANGQVYYVDVCIEFERSEPEFYQNEWNNKILIEVLYTHRNTAIKEQNLRTLPYGVFEYNASRLKFSEKDLKNEDFMDRVGKKYAGFFKEGTYLRKIHNPSAETEKNVDQLEAKIDELKVELSQLKTENNELKSTLLMRDKELSDLKFELNLDTDEFKKSKYFKKWLRLEKKKKR